MGIVKVLQGDITKQHTDAIVNAANSSLLGGSGVDGAIHRAGGPEVLNECIAIRNRQGGCKTGEAVITTAGKMPAKFVIHTVGPVWQGGNNNEEILLKNAYTNSLKLAAENNCTSVAFPNISTGIYGFPKDKAAGIAIDSVYEFLRENNVINEVVFVCFDEENYALYNSIIKQSHR